MNTITSFSITFALTLTACILLAKYLGSHLYQILLDLCRTNERAQFWKAFSNTLLVGLPAIIALKFQPKASTLEESFFEILGRLGGNLAGFLLMLICIGILISFFALVAPRTKVDA